MIYQLRSRLFMLLAVFAVVGLATVGPVLAKKPGGGGGGGDPVLPPVRYVITKVLGADFVEFDTNEAGAVVGKYIALDSRNGHAAAYLPWLSTARALDLNDPLLGVVGTPDGWHLRTALGINNMGGIVGNMEPDDPEDDRKGAFYLDTFSMTVTVLGPFDPGAVYEEALAINDSGDIVIVSDGTMYVGNPGLYANALIAFERVEILALIDFAPSAGATLDVLASSGHVDISNRLAAGVPAIITANLDDGLDPVGFRMTADQSFFESANYEDGSGNRYGIRIVDINDLGDAAGTGRIDYAKKRRGSSYRNFGAIWKLGETQIDAVIPGVTRLWINNDGDALNNSPLWHNTWSATNGEIDIQSLIHPDDPNRNLFNRAFELTDGVPIADPNSTNPLDFWPVIIARGQETVDGVNEYSLLILDPIAAP